MSIKEQVRQLWKTCFDDDDAFIDLYFRLRYTDKINKVIEEDGKVISALQMIPYPMTFCGQTVATSYISGACTHPDYRARGAMRRLLQETHRAMFAEGVMFATLIPAEEWLKGYYARSGYATCFHYGLVKKVINSYEQPVDNSVSYLKMSKIDLLKTPQERIYPYFYEQMNRRPCCVQHTPDDFHVVLSDLALSKGDVWIVDKNGGMSGLVFCLMDGNTLSVKEILLSDEADFAEVLRQLAASYCAERLECIVPRADEMHELGMARLIDVASCLKVFSAVYRGEGLYIRVTGDEAIPQNNGYYTVLPGKVSRDMQEGQTYVTFTISELTAFILHDLHPYMSLMLN